MGSQCQKYYVAEKKKAMVEQKQHFSSWRDVVIWAATLTRVQAQNEKKTECNTAKQTNKNNSFGWYSVMGQESEECNTITTNRYNMGTCLHMNKDRTELYLSVLVSQVCYNKVNKTTKIYSLTSGDWKSKIKVSTGLVPFWRL